MSRYDGQEFVNFGNAERQGDSAADLENNRNISVIREDRSGHLWFGGRGGLSRYDGESFTTFTSEDDLATAAAYIYDIVEDQAGILWFLTSLGLTRFDGVVFQSRLNGDGFTFSGPIHQAANGDFWFGAEEGLVRYRPPQSDPPIHITDVVSARRHGPVAELRLPSTAPLLAIEFQGISFTTRPGQLVYLYRLHGHEEEWQQTRQTRVEYSDLPPGKYRFEVKAVDRDLNYSTTPASLELEVYHQPVRSAIRIDDLHIEELFASFYKTYAERPFGSVRLSNDDSQPIETTLRIFIPELMRQPALQAIALAPNSSRVMPLTAAFDEAILERRQSAAVGAEVALSFAAGQQTFSLQEEQQLTVHGRGALTWDDLGMAAVFITPEDRHVAALARSLYARFKAQLDWRAIDGNLPLALLLYEGLNAHGVKYARDASTAAAQGRGARAAIDHIQYPGELLRSRLGDCDDLTVLYCALLENLGVRTALIDHPEHILMMFDTGIDADRYLGFALEPSRYIERSGRLWIPVEMTMLGEGNFLEAWALGAATCQRQGYTAARSTEVRAVWPEYPYALLPDDEELELPEPSALEAAFNAGLVGLEQLRAAYIDRQYLRPLLDAPDDHGLRLDFAHMQIQAAEYTQAISTLMVLLQTEHRADALYYIGFCYAGLEQYAAAVDYMRKALEADPDNRGYQRSLAVLAEALER